MKKHLLFIALIAFSLGFSQSTDSAPSKWRIGGGVGLNLGLNNDSYFGFNIAPFVGYSIHPSLEAGMTTGYQYSKWKNAKQNLFSFGPYLHFYPNQNLFLRAHYEYFTGNSKINFPTNSSFHFSEDALWLGGGYRSTGKVQLYTGVLYNVLYKEDSSMFSNAFMPFVGVGIAL